LTSTGGSALPQSQNRYAYVRNNPITRIDPNGMDGACEVDPLCGGCDPITEECGPFGGYYGGGYVSSRGGETPKPRPFPWPHLIGLFGALEDDQHDQKPKPSCTTTILRPGMNGLTFYDACGDANMRLIWAVDCIGDQSCCRTEIPKWKSSCVAPNGESNPAYKFIIWDRAQLSIGWCCRKKN
jgi:hypothetical protein